MTRVDIELKIQKLQDHTRMLKDVTSAGEIIDILNTDAELIKEILEGLKQLDAEET